MYDIRLVKLVNGDMVIGKWDGDKNLIKDLVMIQTVPTQGGGAQMMLLPFGYPFDQEVDGEISTTHVMYQYKNVPEELKTKYLEACTNLILSAPSGLNNLNATASSNSGSKIII